MMSTLLIGIGLVFCVALALTGHVVPMIIGGVIGSFLGIAGFGGAISGAIPGAIVGAIVSMALKKGDVGSGKA
jgi:hypothetical protein